MKYDDVIIGMFCRYNGHIKVEVIDKEYRGPAAHVLVRDIERDEEYTVSPRNLQELCNRIEMEWQGGEEL